MQKDDIKNMNLDENLKTKCCENGSTDEVEADEIGINAQKSAAVLVWTRKIQVLKLILQMSTMTEPALSSRLMKWLNLKRVFEA